MHIDGRIGGIPHQILGDCISPCLLILKVVVLPVHGVGLPPADIPIQGPAILSHHAQPAGEDGKGEGGCSQGQGDSDSFCDIHRITSLFLQMYRRPILSL